MAVLLGFLAVVYIIDTVLLFIYGINIFYMIFLSRKNFKKCELPDDLHIADYPMVTIQLPLFNEQYVAERIIHSAVQIDYPKERMEIQVLDDSTDETIEISRKVVEEYKAKGFDITLIHRIKRTGQKGGALREALEVAKGEFIAIFDADFIPAPEILRKTIPVFLQDNRVGMVQTRWGHLNSDYSLLTRAQAVGIDAHFIIEQVARYGEELFSNFNGTAGLWRKSTIADAGNWQDDTLTEDLDLSYRAILAGWKVRYIKDVVSPAELPVQMNAYKSQQFRWAKGSIQTAVKLMSTVLKSRFPLRAKFQALLHLTYYGVHPLLLLNIFLSIPAILFASYFLHSYEVVFGMFSVLCTMSSMSYPALCVYSQYKLYPDWKSRLKWIPLMTVVGTGVAVNNTKAFFEALMGKKSEFVRTPKMGIKAKSETYTAKKYQMKFNLLSFTELFLGLYTLLGIVASAVSGNYFILPFLMLYCVSFFYVFSTGIYQTMKAAA